MQRNASPASLRVSDATTANEPPATLRQRLKHSSSELLVDLIVTEVQASKSLLDALDSEYQALKTRNGEALEAALADKQQRADELELATNRRLRFLDGEAGTNTLLDTAFMAPAQARDRLLHAISELRQAAEQISVRNQANGRLLAMSHQAAELLLGAIRNESPAPATYGPQGELPDTVFSRPLAKA